MNLEDNPESKPNSAEFRAASSPLDLLSPMLGVIETEEIRLARSQAIEAIVNQSDEAQEIVGVFIVSFQAVAEQYEGIEYDRAKIGVDLEVARFWRDAGKLDYYIDALYDTVVICEQRVEFADILAELRPIYEQALMDVGLA